MNKLILSLMLALSLSGCAVTNTSLYDQLGQTDGIKRIVEDFINELLVDTRVDHHFEDADLDNFHDRLVEQICELADGPCQYTGKAMKALHENMAIDEAQFNAVAEAMMTALDNSNISVGAQNQLLALLVPMRTDIVTK